MSHRLGRVETAAEVLDFYVGCVSVGDAANGLGQGQGERDVDRADALVDVAQQLCAQRLRIHLLNELLGDD